MANEKTIETKDDANLGLAMLIAEFGEGNYQPVRRRREHQRSPRDRSQRHARSDKGPLARRRSACPERYVVWAQGADGGYRQVKEIVP